jgi:biopolymer transport protein ExbD
MNFRSTSRRRDDAQLDLTPLIDCVFLLLIFFLVTATFTQQTERTVVPVDLPTGTSGEAAQAEEQFTIYLASDGSYSLRSDQGEERTGLQRGELEEALRDLHSRQPGAALYLRGDQEVRYGEVMRLLDIAREIGFRRVFNVIQSPD